MCVVGKTGEEVIIPSFRSKESRSTHHEDRTVPVTDKGASHVPGVISKAQLGISNKQLSSHPSPLTSPPSSHSSHAHVSKILSPHTTLHVTPSPVNPVLQVQEKLPVRLLHAASSEQLSIPNVHSSISSQGLHGIEQVYPDSIAVQVSSHPSHELPLLSSHTSPLSGCITPSPQYNSVALHKSSDPPFVLTHSQFHHVPGS